MPEVPDTPPRRSLRAVATDLYLDPFEPLREAPVWLRIGTLVCRRGDEFYSFDGLRSFKQKFGPAWTPDYMTCPGGFSIPRAVLDVALLVSRPKLGS